MTFKNRNSLDGALYLATSQLLCPSLTFITDIVSQKMHQDIPHLPMSKGKKGAFTASVTPGHLVLLGGQAQGPTE